MKGWHVAALLFCASGNIEAQQANAAQLGMAAAVEADTAAESTEAGARRPAPLTVTLASAVLPGTGQALLRQRRALDGRNGAGRRRSGKGRENNEIQLCNAVP